MSSNSSDSPPTNTLPNTSPEIVSQTDAEVSSELAKALDKVHLEDDTPSEIPYPDPELPEEIHTPPRTNPYYNHWLSILHRIDHPWAQEDSHPDNFRSLYEEFSSISSDVFSDSVLSEERSPYTSHMSTGGRSLEPEGESSSTPAGREKTDIDQENSEGSERRRQDSQGSSVGTQVYNPPESETSSMGDNTSVGGIPDLRPCGKFDGSESAARWLAQLHWEFRRVGHSETTMPPSEVISAIDMLCVKDAATLLDSDLQMQDAIAKANSGTADKKDLEKVEQTLKDRFPAKLVDPRSFEIEDLTRIAQREDELLVQWYDRVRMALRNSGGRDRPRITDNRTTPLTPAESTLLKTVISRFVDGLRNYDLRQESLTNHARSAESLAKCWEAVQDSERVLEDRAKAAKEQEDRAQIESIKRALAERNLTVEQAISQVQTEPIMAMGAQRPNQEAQLSRQNSWRAPWDNRGTYPAKNRQTSQSSQNNYPPRLPPRESSKNPLVNGTEKLNAGERACFRCGAKDHIQTRCEATRSQWLESWEQAYLRGMITPASRYNRIPSLPVQEVQARSAQLYFEQFLKDCEDEGDAEEENETLTVGSHSVTVTQGTVPGGGLRLDEELSVEVSFLQSLLAAAMPPNKKRKAGDTAIPVSSLVDDQSSGQAQERKKKPQKTKTSAPKPLTEVRGREGKGPMDYKALLEQNKIEVSLLDLLQVSPDFCKNLKYLSTRMGEKARKTARRYAVMREKVVQSSSAVIKSIKTYRITPIIKFPKGDQVVSYKFDTESVLADQGSDVNIINAALADKIGLRRRPLDNLGVKGLVLLDSSGKSSPITEFTVFNAVVEGISRSVWAVVQPPGGGDDIVLLLGLPWLWDVMASFDIRGNSLTIGDTTAGETPVVLQGPALKLHTHHKLILDPGHVQEEDLEESESSDEEDADDSSEDSEN
ncbi:hypothetical protein ABKA04_001130 [Annulohypoxylon sp. FPYF3050]